MTSLPDNLPTSLQEVHCQYNKIAKLPNNLPDSLRVLDFTHNELTEIPDNLPVSLKRLSCSHNKLTTLPNKWTAPLFTLEFSGNKITKIPDNLPVSSLDYLYFYGNQITTLPDYILSIHSVQHWNNPYLYIGKQQAEKLQCVETPNYTECANTIKKIWMARKRYKRLVFCKNLKEHACEYLLRPGNYYYYLLKQQNAHLFIT